MSKSISWMVVAMLALLLAPAVLANEEAAAAAVTISGTVAVTKGEDGAVKSVMISEDKEHGATYTVTMDDECKKVAAMDKKMVKAMGTVSEKDGVKMLTCTSCEEVAAAAK